MTPCGFIESDTERIYFENWGETGDAVILTHGLGGSHAVWYQQVPFLAQRYRVITWDQRGFGNSTRVTGTIGPVPAVDDMVRVLDGLDIDRAHVIGQSMGGWACLGFAIDHPERAISLTPADTTAGIFTPQIRQTLADYGQAIAQGPPLDVLPLGRDPAIGYQARRGHRALVPVHAVGQPHRTTIADGDHPAADDNRPHRMRCGGDLSDALRYW